MAVTRARLNSYRAEVDACGEAAATYVERYLAAITAGSPDAEVSEVREAAIESIEDALGVFGDQASELALDLFEEIVGAGHDAQIYDVIDPDQVDEKVRYYARDLVEGDVASFSRNVTDLTRYYVKRSAFENMAENCERGEVRYARVPSGRETCSFCYMLSSRGFVYHTEGTAGADHPYHRNCDCVIVPGYEGLDPDSQVEGYSPTELYRRWKGCAETVGEDPDTRDETALGRIRAEVETRDWRWLNEGKRPGYTVLDGASPNADEIATAERLDANGFRSEFRPTRDTEMLKTSDLFLVKQGGDGGEVRTEWEIKNPRGSGKQTIYHQFEEAAGQAHMVVIDLANTGPGIYDDIDAAVELASRFIKYHYTVKGGADDGSTWMFDEALIIAKDGSIRRIKRGN